MARIVVCGAGVCGLTAAMLLAEDGHEVTVLERDAAGPPSDPASAWDGWERRGVGQFRLPHFLLGGFRAFVHDALPAVEDALLAAGALRMNVLGPFAEALDPEDRNVVITARRPLVEAAVAGVAEGWPGVTIRRGVALDGVVTEPGPRVVGVRTADGEEVRADLVVDALGRRSPMSRWLVEAGSRAPIVEEEDSGFVYYGRHVRTADGSPIGPGLTFHGSIGLLALPADGGVSGIGIITWSGDAALRAARHPDAWNAVIGLLPGGDAVLAAEPIDDEVVVMAGIEDRYRRYVVDGAPVATGVVSMADAWAATNPTLGRGISLGVRHAGLLRRIVAEVGTDDHEGLVCRFDEATEAEQAPWYRSTVWHDRHRIADFQAAIEGRERDDDPTWERFLAFSDAAFGDLALLPHFLDTFRLERRPEDVVDDPSVIAHLEANGITAPAQDGPPREAVLAAVAAAR